MTVNDDVIKILIDEIKEYEKLGGKTSLLIYNHVTRCEFLNKVIEKHPNLNFEECYPLVSEIGWKSDIK